MLRQLLKTKTKTKKLKRARYAYVWNTVKSCGLGSWWHLPSKHRDKTRCPCWCPQNMLPHKAPGKSCSEGFLKTSSWIKSYKRGNSIPKPSLLKICTIFFPGDSQSILTPWVVDDAMGTCLEYLIYKRVFVRYRNGFGPKSSLLLRLIKFLSC